MRTRRRRRPNCKAPSITRNHQSSVPAELHPPSSFLTSIHSGSHSQPSEHAQVVSHAQTGAEPPSSTPSSTGLSGRSSPSGGISSPHRPYGCKTSPFAPGREARFQHIPISGLPSMGNTHNHRDSRCCIRSSQYMLNRPKSSHPKPATVGSTVTKSPQ